jgi:hypothetical protein
MCHESHVTRISTDSSSYDEICINCNATDIAGGGWGKLAYPCPNASPEYQAEIDRAQEDFDNEIVERISKIYAEATGYYVPFHSGLSSESSDLIRKGIRAVLEELGEI